MGLHGLPWLVVVTGILLTSGGVTASDRIRDADSEMFPRDVVYDARIPTPASHLGFELGSAPVRHHQLVDYLRTLAALSDRITVETIGYSHERRPILFLTVTSPENHARIDEIRRHHNELTEPSANRRVDDDLPVVTWLNYGVHGAESAGMDAALPTVYYLAAATGPKVEEILDESIVLVTAVFNPDGHAKRAGWFDRFGSQVTVSDPQHLEHNYDGQVLRTNHYGFDLNRQWLLLTQPEPRAWIRKWHEWRPNVSVDYHEMGPGFTYYFHPGAVTRTHPLVPDEAERLMGELGRASEAFLDSEGRLYFHGERYDNFYFGKGSTYPLVNGAVGILYEAGAAKGVEIETPNGLRSYRENIRKHFRTSISSVEDALKNRIALLTYQQWFYASALEAADAHRVKAYVFDAVGDSVRLTRFVELLRLHRIDAYQLDRDIEVDGQGFSADSAIIVPLRQAQHRMIRAIFETITEFEDSTFYDVSSWTIPLAFNLNYAALEGRYFRGNLLGSAATAAAPTVPAPGTTSYGYVFEWTAYFAPRALYRVLDAGLLARVATRVFELQTTEGSRRFAAGSVFVPFDRQELAPGDIHEIMRTIAAEDRVLVHAVTSGRSDSGSVGINPGGPSFVPVERPEVLLVTGRDTDLYDAGAAWHLLDYRMRVPVTLQDRSMLDGLDWTRYSHVIFPGGEYEEYLPEYLDPLRRWVDAGGTVIGLRQAAPWLRANVLDYEPPEDVNSSTGANNQAAQTASPQPGDAHAEPTVRINYAEKESRDALEVIGGAIFSGDLDTTHPLGFGYRRRQIPLHKNMSDVMCRPENPYATVIAYSEQPLLSGYASEANRAAIAGSAALIADRRGNGSVILFADDPNFRAIWYGTNKLFMNALFFSTVFQPQAD